MWRLSRGVESEKVQVNGVHMELALKLLVFKATGLQEGGHREQEV